VGFGQVAIEAQRFVGLALGHIEP